jgi:hypothetical protein
MTINAPHTQPDRNVRPVAPLLPLKQHARLGAPAGTMIGAAAVTGLHAQAKPPVYLINEIDVTDPEGYEKEFVPKAQPIIRAAGGLHASLTSTCHICHNSHGCGCDRD